MNGLVHWKSGIWFEQQKNWFLWKWELQNTL